MKNRNYKVGTIFIGFNKDGCFNFYQIISYDESIGYGIQEIGTKKVHFEGKFNELPENINGYVADPSIKFGIPFTLKYLPPAYEGLGDVINFMTPYRKGDVMFK